MEITWLFNSIEPSVATTTRWVQMKKELWDCLKERFGQLKNISRLYKLYEAFFSCQQGDKSLK